MKDIFAMVVQQLQRTQDAQLDIIVRLEKPTQKNVHQAAYAEKHRHLA